MVSRFTYGLDALRGICEDCPAINGEIALVQVMGKSVVGLAESGLNPKQHFVDNGILRIDDTIIARVVIANAKNQEAQGINDVKRFNSYFNQAVGTCDVYTPEELVVDGVEIPACKAVTIATKKFIEQMEG